MTAGERPVEALAIGGGKVLAAGSASDVSPLMRRQTQIIDLAGRVAFPGFIDPHHHTVLSALFADLLLNVGYPKYADRAAALAAVKAAVAKTPPGQWIRAGYYDNLLQGGDLSMAALDAIRPASDFRLLRERTRRRCERLGVHARENSARMSANCPAAAISAARLTAN